jgi:lincosamide nucleotidyltransferase A/C/D/E
MTAERVLELLAVLRSGGVAATLDGGWGIDALLGRETRPHEDLDLVVALGDVPRIRELLGPFGFTLHEDHLPVRFVLRRTGEQLDFHTVSFDAEGGGVQPQLGGGSFRYPPEGFVLGRVRGESVPCVSAAVQVLCHLGYEPTAKDAHDVLGLCHAFDLPIPEAYARFVSTGAPPGSSKVTLLAGASVYGLLVFLGTAGLGFAVLPSVGRAAGLDAEAQAAFSFLTLKAVPFLAGLAAAAALSYPWLRGLTVPRRAAVYAATTAFAWLAGAAIAAAILG